MGSFFLPKFGNVNTSFLGFLFDGGEFTVLTEASVGPTYRGNAGPLIWNYELDDAGEVYSGDIGIQQNL